MITVRSSTGSQTATSPTTWPLTAFTTNPVKGDTIIVCQSWFTSGTTRTSTTPTDTYGNTYTQVGTDSTFASVAGIAIWYGLVTKTGPSFVVSVNISGAALLGGIARCVYYTAPTAYASGDFTKVSTSGTTSATTGNSAVIPPPASFFVACVSDLQTDPAAYTPGAGWNARSVNQTNNGTGQDLGSADFLNNDASVQAATWTGPNGTFGTYSAMIASFLAGPVVLPLITRPFPYKPGQPPSRNSPFR